MSGFFSSFFGKKEDAAPQPTRSAPPPTATTPATDIAPEGALQLDLAFVCDCTGSMGSYIKSAQDNIRKIAMDIHQRTQNRVSVRYALIKYRDHPPQDRTFVTETFSFSPSIELTKKAIDSMSASGGGDGPEAVAAALHELRELPWRANATKVAVLIADAPPHGLGESGDGFPQGCPQGHDPIKICKDLAGKGVTVYAVGVEPVLSSSYKFARDFMMMVAKVTEGKFLPLGKAAILSDVIVNGALEGLNLQEIWAKLEAETVNEAAAAGQELSEEALVAAVNDKMQVARSKVAVAHVEVANPYMEGYDDANVDRLMKCESMRDAKLDSFANAHVPQATAAYNWSAQEAKCSMAPMSEQQCARMDGHAKKSRKMFSWGS